MKVSRVLFRKPRRYSDSQLDEILDAGVRKARETRRKGVENRLKLEDHRAGARSIPLLDTFSLANFLDSIVHTLLCNARVRRWIERPSGSREAEKEKKKFLSEIEKFQSSFRLYRYSNLILFP